MSRLAFAHCPLPTLLVCALALGGCSPKPSQQAGTKPSAAASAGASPQQPSSLLQAELRRDPTAVASDDLIAQDATRRLAAVRTLAKIRDPRSFEPLTKALADEDPFIIGWAAFGVGQLCRSHEPEAVRRLVLRAASLSAAAVSDEGDRALGNIALALGRCASDEAEKTLRDDRGVARRRRQGSRRLRAVPDREPASAGRGRARTPARSRR